MQTTDDALTNLSWLIHQQEPFAPIKPQSPPPSPPASSADASRGRADFSNLSTSPLDHSWAPSTPVDYHYEPVKPPYSYAQLIAMAMQAHGNKKVLLTNIYSWIRENFAYFRTNDTTWQNSVRHNLSLNKQFIKVPRDPRDKGKGSYWMLDPRMKDSYCLRRRSFGEFSHRKLQQQDTIRPQVNPAIKLFLQSTNHSNGQADDGSAGASNSAHCRRCWSQEEQENYNSMEDAAAVAAICENFGDLGSQECLYSSDDPGFLDFSDKLFKAEFLAQDVDYSPLGGPLFEVDDDDDVNKVSMEQQNWESFRDFVELNGTTDAGQTFDANVSNLPLRIPTPEWWDNVNSANSLLMSSCAAGLPSPPSSGHRQTAGTYGSLSQCSTDDIVGTVSNGTGPCANHNNPSSSEVQERSNMQFDKSSNSPFHQWTEERMTNSGSDIIFLDIESQPSKPLDPIHFVLPNRSVLPPLNP